MDYQKNVKIKTYTWTKDSHKLFDYESSHLFLNKTFCGDSLNIVRNNHEVQFIGASQGESSPDHAPLCNLKKTSDGKFFLSSANAATPLKLVIRSLKCEGKQQGYELKVGDKIQIGRVEYFIREVRDEQNNTVKADFHSISRTENEMDIEESKEAKHCRICLEEETKDSDNMDYIFVSPCKCKGTSKYVHVHCLRAWLESKRQQHKPNPMAQTAQQAVAGFNIAMFLGGGHINDLLSLPNSNNPMHTINHMALNAFLPNFNFGNMVGNFSQRRLGLPNPYISFNHIQSHTHSHHSHNTNPHSTVNISNTNINLTTNPTVERDETINASSSDNPITTLNVDINVNVNVNEANPYPNLFNPINTFYNNNNTSNGANPNTSNLNSLLNPNGQSPSEESSPTAPTTHSILNGPEQNVGGVNPPLPSLVENHNFLNFSCDVCKEILPYTLKLDDNTEIETVKIPRPEDTPYLILERASQGKEPKVISVIKGNPNQEVKLGRGHLSDIIISDISVSRLHALIRYQNGKFVMIDNNSKFGTLVRLDDPIEIQKDKLGIQCGRTLITVSLKVDKPVQQHKENPQFVMTAVENLREKMQSVFIRKQQQQQQQQQQLQSLSPDKRVQSQIKISREARDGESEGTLDVEEISPIQVGEISTRSKKISKAGKKK